ncbi:unnamed protein product [Gongylonema pulchrum]|uniref:Pilus assembly protein n=1 Tax=Gongylonema pulchrum TaxID=637853 RepID=A0A183F0V6_9BILA|nr:unnamed protein product [Gongylonema pulchrum]
MRSGEKRSRGRPGPDRNKCDEPEQKADVRRKTIGDNVSVCLLNFC